MAYRIVTFDGGGIRGLISVLLLQKLQERVDFIGRVGLFAGTSTGSFIALSLAQDATAESIRQVVELYEHQGPALFTRHFPPPVADPAKTGMPALAPSPAAASVPAGGWFGTKLKELARNLAHDWQDWNDLFHVAYTTAGLQQTLERHFAGHPAQTLGALGTEVLVNTVQLWNAPDARWSPFELTRHSTPELSLTEAALCSGAAPTYFPPFAPKTHELGYCVDGGLYANNPAMGALAHALRHGHLLPDIRLLAIGTGTALQGIRELGNPNNWGALSWSYPYPTRAQPAMPMLAAMLDTSAMMVDSQIRQIMGNGYRRLNVTLDAAIPLDDASAAALEDMHKVVGRMVNGPAWEQLVEWMERHFLDDGNGDGADSPTAARQDRSPPAHAGPR